LTTLETMEARVPAGAAGGVEVLGAATPGYDEILTPAALDLVAMLERRFGAERLALLDRRAERQARIDAGAKPDFLPGTAEVRAGDWTIAPVPADLQDRRVEITGPVERKMIINALNSGASVFMADFEDSCAPTWDNLIAGHINLRDAVARTITFDDAARGKSYRLNERTATLLVRPRGWHLTEAHVRVDGAPVSAGIFDFALYLFHNADALKAAGSGPYYYLPKMESHLEARLWNDVFVAAQEALGLPQGTIKATVLIETILAAFEMDEILFELREHSAGLNCGRWDYIFSIIKKFRNDPNALMPDRAQVTMERHCMRSYSLLAIKTCHRRNAHAIGGMAAQIPIRGDETANRAALDKVRADKAREAGDGHDGTWVAHPGLVAIAKEEFDKRMPEANQIGRARDDVAVEARDLLETPEGAITEAGVRLNVTVGIRYIESWLRGNGCVPLFNLMEDAATAEISRAQLWQWLRHGATLDSGRTVDAALVKAVIAEEVLKIRVDFGAAENRLDDAVALFETVATAPDFAEFLTLPAYEKITTMAAGC
jgi:malate synthase